MPATSSGCKITFENGRGLKLCGHLERPNGAVRAWAIFAHCFTCNKNYKAPVYLGRQLAERGVGVLRFDFPGLGASEGDFADTTLSGYVEDVRYAAAWLEQSEEAPRVLIGHSMGGASVLLAASSLPSVEIVTTLAATAKPANLRHNLAKAYEQAKKFGTAELTTTAGRTFQLRYDFFEDLQRHDIQRAVQHLEKNLLIVHDPDDDTVPFESAKLFEEWANPPRSLLSLPGAGHLFTDEQILSQIAGAIVARVR